MVYLAKAKRVCSVKEISQKEKIPFDFLEKIFSKLQKEGLVKSQRGPRGGYFLDKSPKKISVREILRVFENKEIFSIQCKRKRYLSKKKCPIKNIWRQIHQILNSTLEKITLADLCEKK